MRLPITANVAPGASPFQPGSARGLVVANAIIVASASLLVAIWLFVPKDTFSGVAAVSGPRASRGRVRLSTSHLLICKSERRPRSGWQSENE